MRLGKVEKEMTLYAIRDAYEDLKQAFSDQFKRALLDLAC